MAYWVKKNIFILPKYFNSLEKKTRIISRIIAFTILLTTLFILKCFYFRLSFLGKSLATDGTYFREFYTSRTWEELMSNLPSIFFESLVYATGIFLLAHFLDYFSKDRYPTLICENCYNIKNFEYDLQCECGGKFVRKDSMDCYVNEEEYKVSNPFTNIIDKIRIRGTNYYKCLSNLPTIIFCPGCLSKIILDNNQKIERKYHCDKCRTNYNLETPDEWIKNGKIEDEYKYDLGFVINGELNISSNDRYKINRKFKLLDDYRHLTILPNKIICPHCNKKIRLYRKEILYRKFKCNYCQEFLDLTIEQGKA